MHAPTKRSNVAVLLIGSFFVAAATGIDAAEDGERTGLRFAKIIADNMVLQQGKPIVIWGWAEPGAVVSVTITQDAAVGEPAMQKVLELEEQKDIRRSTPPQDDGEYSVQVQYVEKNPPKLETQTVEATADGNGAWRATFKPAKGSFQETWILATAGDEKIGARNVLVGEVWVCAGQSNMDWGNFNRKGREAASADFPGLRYVDWDDSWYKPLDDVRANIHWRECSPEAAERFSAVPYLYGMFLHRYLKVPIGVINVARGGTLGQAWCLREELDNIDNKIIKTVLSEYDAETATWDDPKQVERIMAQWEAACETAKEEHEKKLAEAKAAGNKEPRLRLPKQPGDPRSGWSPPAGLFNATIMPIRQLGIRGALYYQGENNNFMRWTRYESTFPKVPVSFRKAFDDAELWFGCISQPGFGIFGLDPEIATVAEGYAIVRDIQHRALKDDPRGGMIATYPTGNSYIHPAEKLPVAEYASLWALANVYDAPIVHRGNRYERMAISDDKLYLFFDIDPVVYDRWKHIENNASWQVLPQPREGKAERLGFIIAGEDRRWYPATVREVKVENKWCLELTSDLVEKPVAARYGWANWPTGNMVGRDRLPVPTFRTDDWPIVEGANYTPEAKEASSAKIDELKKLGERQALDRKIRQMMIDLPRLEKELYLGRQQSLKKLVASKVARTERILDEMKDDEWLSRAIERYPEFVNSIQTLREKLDAVKQQVETIEEGN
jgi:sialate O-acetylesterase